MRERLSRAGGVADPGAVRRHRTTDSRARGSGHVGTSRFGTDARTTRWRQTTVQPSLPLRMLLKTDGSVTAMLEASFRTRVAVETR